MHGRAYDLVVPTVAALVDALQSRINPDTAAPWDPVGLQLGDPAATADVIGVCHEVTEAVVERIEDNPVDLLVTYHPLLFDPVNRVVGGPSPGGRAHRLIRAGVGIYVTHTDFDAAPGGAADALADELELRDVAPFGLDYQDESRIGRVGRFEGTAAELLALVTERLRPSGLRSSLDMAEEVDHVAVVPGSGSDFIAAASGLARVLVTGDVSHHRAVGALDGGLAVIDPGHIATERPGLRALVRLVRDVAGADVIDLTSIDPATWV
jgi:dinuclear metal center YbgI/SA1388 family protein